MPQVAQGLLCQGTYSGQEAAFVRLSAGRRLRWRPAFTLLTALTTTAVTLDVLPAAGGNPDSNTLISDSTTVICLDDYHSLDRTGRKKEGVTALDPKAQDFDLMAEQVGRALIIACAACASRSCCFMR